MQDSRNIFLVGLMGAGKTTVARQLARRLGKTFYDTDHEIERRTGVRVQVIFEIEGEPGFRAREAQMLESLTALQDVVLGTGGGVVLNPENRALLSARGFVIYEGQGGFAREAFRVANMGALAPADFERFLAALADVLER